MDGLGIICKHTNIMKYIVKCIKLDEMWLAEIYDRDRMAQWQQQLTPPVRGPQNFLQNDYAHI